MSVTQGESIRYDSKRRRSDARHRIQVMVGAEMPKPAPGSLEFFLIERYLLYSFLWGRLVTGRVFHAPYALQAAELEFCEESMLAANGLPAKPWEHLCFSPGVDVEVFAAEWCDDPLLP
jgi:uncharacterized protein YqjF (DUF2071 family)